MTKQKRHGVGFKLSVLSCFYVLFVNVLALGFEGGALIWGEANGDADVDLSLLAVPAAQGLAWFVLSFSALYCKFKVSERFPFLLRAWWFLSFVICLCTLYVDAAEATLRRRLHADQKEDDFVPLESVITPLEGEINIYRNEVLNTNHQIPPS